jgi:hypothetical protein
MKVKELKELLNQFSDDDEMVFAYLNHEYGTREYELDCDLNKEILKVFHCGSVSDDDVYACGKPLPCVEKEFLVLHV